METLEQLFEKIPVPGAFGPSFQIMISRHYGNEQWPNAKKWLCNISGHSKKFHGDTPAEAIKKALDWWNKRHF
jgi:hypothetical protein